MNKKAKLSHKSRLNQRRHALKSNAVSYLFIKARSLFVSKSLYTQRVQNKI